MRASMSTSRLSASAAVVLLAALLAGCGSAGAGRSPQDDPASVVPSSAPLYLGVVVRPHGELQHSAVAVARRITHLKDPFAKLLDALQSESKDHFAWSELKPWLGERAGLFISSVGGSGSPLGALQAGVASGSVKVNRSETDGALILDATDVSRARAFLAAQTARVGGRRSATYRGVGYQLDAEQDASAIVGHFAVIGSETGLKSVIDTFDGAAALPSLAAYKRLSGLAPAEALASLYISPAALFSSVRTHDSEDAQALAAFRALLKGDQQLYASLLPSGDAITIDAYALSGESPEAGAEQAAKTLAGLPASSWLALASGDLGGAAERDMRLLHDRPSLGHSPLSEVLGPLQSKGIDLRRDLLGWMGPAGLFVSGSSLLDLRAALVISSKDPARSRAAVGKIAALVRGSGATTTTARIAGTDAAIAVKLKGSPLPLYLADGQGKFIVGLGEASISQALSPSGSFEKTAIYRDAVNALKDGIHPSLVLSLPPLTGALEAISLQGGARSLGLDKALPYLKSLNLLAAGSGRVGGAYRARLVLTLR